jgi:transmembrane sensor
MTSAHPLRPDDPALEAIAEAAATWLVRLHSGEAAPAENAAFQDWLAGDPRHRRVWQQMEGAIAPALRGLHTTDDGARTQASLARRVLLRPGTKRRSMLYGVAALAALGGGAGALVHRATPLNTLLAELRTATGERRAVRLADGSAVLLNARSAADVRFSDDTRELRLRTGALLVTAAREPQRPLVIDLPTGQVLAQDGRFLVEWRGEGHARVAALEHTLRLENRAGRQLSLRPGEVARLDTESIERLPGDAKALAAWQDGLLDLRDGTLGEVIEALRPYRAGLLRVSEAAARLPVFGVFRLDDGDDSLRALAETLPIVVSRLGPWVTRIDLR